VGACTFHISGAGLELLGWPPTLHGNFFPKAVSRGLDSKSRRLSDSDSHDGGRLAARSSVSSWKQKTPGIKLLCPRSTLFSANYISLSLINLELLMLSTQIRKAVVSEITFHVFLPF
jgi:hypothetical protein